MTTTPQHDNEGILILDDLISACQEPAISLKCKLLLFFSFFLLCLFFTFCIYLPMYSLIVSVYIDKVLLGRGGNMTFDYKAEINVIKWDNSSHPVE